METPLLEMCGIIAFIGGGQRIKGEKKKRMKMGKWLSLRPVASPHPSVDVGRRWRNCD